MDQNSLRKTKMYKCKTCSSKKMLSHSECNAPDISNKEKGKNSKDIKECSLSTSKNSNFTAEEALKNSTCIEESKIRNYADILAKTEKIWSQNDLDFKKPITLKSGLYLKQERCLKINWPPKKASVAASVFWESKFSGNFTLSPQCEDTSSADSLLSEIRSLVLEDKLEKDKASTDLSESSSKNEDLKSTAENLSINEFDYLNQLLDEDSAYGSDESLPRSSPEPTDVETGSDTSAYDEIFEDCTDPTKFDSETELNSSVFEYSTSSKPYSKLYSDHDTESIGGDSDHDTECICEDSDHGAECIFLDYDKTEGFQEFLKGLVSTKPRLISHAAQICAICKNEIADKFSLVNRFGLLLNCEHPFCYNCVFSACFHKKYPVSLFKVRCPICNEFSPGIVSSPRWIKSKIKKANLFRDLKLAFIETLIFKLYLKAGCSRIF